MVTKVTSFSRDYGNILLLLSRPSPTACYGSPGTLQYRSARRQQSSLRDVATRPPKGCPRGYLNSVEETTMKRVAVIVGLCALLLSAAAWADEIKLTNNFGTVSVTNAGIVSQGMELKSYGLVTAGKGQSLGPFSFSTEAFPPPAAPPPNPLFTETLPATAHPP